MKSRQLFDTCLNFLSVNVAYTSATCNATDPSTSSHPTARSYLLGLDGQVHVVHGLAEEGRGAGEQHVAQHAQAPHVALVVVVAAQHLATAQTQGQTVLNCLAASNHTTKTGSYCTCHTTETNTLPRGRCSSRSRPSGSASRQERCAWTARSRSGSAASWSCGPRTGSSPA
jgi:hypothetical protein